MAQRTFTLEFLSASTDGAPILVVPTATPGELIHTAPAGTTSTDVLEVYVCNTHTSQVAVTAEVGGVTAAHQHPAAVMLEPNSERRLLLDGVLLRNGLALRIFASVASKVTVSGKVRRAAP